VQSTLKNKPSQQLSIVADQQILFAEEAFSAFGDVELVDGRTIDHNTIQDADVLLVRSVTGVNESLLKDSSVKFVGSATSGIDHIDTDFLSQSNISFSHALGSNARSVAEYVLSSLLVLAEQQSFDLREKTVGIIGCGQVGSRVKRFMDALGIECLLNDPLLAKHSPNNYVELEALQNADIITLHVPLTKDGEFPTHKLIDKTFLEKLKPEVILVNTSRGEVVDEKALLKFKQTNSAATLILDVWCNEPNIDINLVQSSFIATPHIAGYSYDGKLKATKMLFTALDEFFGSELEKPGLLESEQSEISIDDNAIQLAVLQSYDVRSDAIALANLANIKEEQRAIYFDSLRKNYPIRHEFKNKIVHTMSMSHDVSQQLQQLGFKVVTAYP